MIVLDIAKHHAYTCAVKKEAPVVTAVPYTRHRCSPKRRRLGLAGATYGDVVREVRRCCLYPAFMAASLSDHVSNPTNQTDLQASFIFPRRPFTVAPEHGHLSTATPPHRPPFCLLWDVIEHNLVLRFRRGIAH